jgi:hypothetical protein
MAEEALLEVVPERCPTSRLSCQVIMTPELDGIRVRVRMAGGALAEIVENPQDGFWLIVRYLDNPAEPALVDAGEQQVFATDVEAIEP